MTSRLHEQLAAKQWKEWRASRRHLLKPRVVGMGHARIMLCHVLPNVVAVAIIGSMADFVLNILTAASLSFLGVGVQDPNPAWG